MKYRLGLGVVLLGLIIFHPNFEAQGDPGDFPESASFSALIKMPLAMQGLTSSADGHFYAAGRNTLAGDPCPVWRIDPENPALVVVGYVPGAPGATCVVIGLALNKLGDIYAGSPLTGKIYTFTPNDAAPPTATEFATAAANVANIAFDREGNLWATDGPSNQGRVWKIPPSGGTAVVQFRIPPMRNSIGVGRDMLRFPQGNAVGLGVATGLAFDEDGSLFVSDISRGAIWKAEFYRDGSLRSKVGCDSTYTADTLCLENAFVQHPILSGGGGIAMDRKGNMWVPSFDRNAMVWVGRDGTVAEVFRNPVNASTNRRNEGPLESPAVPVLLGGLLCVSNLDADIQDNSPNSAGEISPAGADRGKIVCMDQSAFTPGMPLPVGDDRGYHHKPYGWPRQD